MEEIKSSHLCRKFVSCAVYKDFLSMSSLEPPGSPGSSGAMVIPTHEEAGVVEVTRCESTHPSRVSPGLISRTAKKRRENNPQLR